MKRKQTKSKKILTRNAILAFSIGAILAGSFGYLIIAPMIPVNADHFVLGAPTNIYIKSTQSQLGDYVFASMSTKGGKITQTGMSNPTYIVEKGSLISIHFINENKGIPNFNHKHNLNIDEFNVHTNNLSYFQSETVTFLADKSGTFNYFCSIHPEMKGTLIVE